MGFNVGSVPSFLLTFPSASFPKDEFEEESVLPLDVMPLNAVGQTFTVLRRPEGSVSLGKLANILRFKLKEIDPSTGQPWGADVPGRGGAVGIEDKKGDC